jgi:hypothetical protein
MTKQMTCWKCGGQLSVTADAVGMQVKCPHCSMAVTVPGELFGAPVAEVVRSEAPPPPTKPQTFSEQNASIINAAIVFSSVELFFGLLGVMVGGAEAIEWLGMFAALGGFIAWLVYHYRVWSLIPTEHAETTPGKAVGFLFIPFYNFAWIFRSCVGLHRSLNAYARSLNVEPPASLTLPMGYSIGFIVSVGLAIIAGLAAESDAGGVCAGMSFFLGSVPAFVFWLMMVLNQKKAAAVIEARQRMPEPSQA